MEKKNLIIIIALLIIIIVLCVGIFSVSTHIEGYEKVNVVPNGTSIEIPSNNLTSMEDVPKNGFKIWSFEQGGVASFNTKEVKAKYHNTNFYSEKGLDEFDKLANTVFNNYEKKEKIDGYKVYTVDGGLVDAGEGRTIYVIMCENKSTEDHILIMTDNKDITLHIANSIDYKMGDLSVYKANYTEWVETESTVPINKYNDGSAFHEEDLNDYYRKTGQEYRIKNDD